MSDAPQRPDPCEQLAELQLELAAGGPLSPAEREFVAAHLAACAACRAEAGALALLAYSPGEEPFAREDALARRRLADSVVGAHEARRRSRRRAWTAAVAAVAAALLLVIGARWVFFGEAPPAPRAPRLAAQPRLLLRSGTPGIDERALRAGEKVRVGAGEVVLQVAPQVRALVAAESALRIATTPSGAPALELTRGELVAEVRPHPGRVAGRGQEREEPRFAVITPAGRCEVTGTVLAVSTRADATHLRVLRGAVRAVGRGGGSRRVAAEQGLELRRMKVRRLSAEELARARAQAARLALPATGADAARLVVRSQPAGAAATLDNIEIGTTPLALAVAAGPHQLRLRRAAHEPVTVMLATRAGETLERSFTLEPRRAKADAGAPDAGIDVRAGAGGTRARRPPRPRPRKVAATELLRETRRLRAARKWRAAAAAYRRLLRDHPRSAAAAAARVALGALYLDKLGKPGAALKLFDGYLARRRSGPLAQEAAYGRIRALRRLGRRAEELRAARRFLREHRGALQAPRVRRRLRALERRGGR